MMNKRIIAEKYLSSGSFKVGEKSLNYQYPNLDAKIIKTDMKKVVCVGFRGQMAIEILEGDGSRNSMKMKIQELKEDKILCEEGIYQEPLSWNEFRHWVLAHPEVMDQWFDIQYGPNARYQHQDDDICWQSIVE